jgi:hypothetical protein
MEHYFLLLYWASKENIILMMKEGRITAIEGGLQAKLFKEWLAS